MKSFFLLLLIWTPCFFAAQADSSKFRWRANAGLILARNFSNYPLRSSDDEVSATKYTAVDSVADYKPGFWLGLDALLLSNEQVKILFGLSFSRTSAAYHSSYTSVGPTSRSGFTQLERQTEMNYNFNYSALNFQGGLRLHIREGFHATPSFLLNSPVRVTRELNGFTRTTYSNNSGAQDSDVIFLKGDKTPLKQKAANISFRLDLSYAFTFSENEGAVHLYRNFGILYALPWWGIGFSVFL